MPIPCKELWHSEPYASFRAVFSKGCIAEISKLLPTEEHFSVVTVVSWTHICTLSSIAVLEIMLLLYDKQNSREDK